MKGSGCGTVILLLIVSAVSIALTIILVQAVVNSDLPLWLKILILK